LFTLFYLRTCAVRVTVRAYCNELTIFFRYTKKSLYELFDIMDTSDGELVPQIIKHPSLYFPDGNIILSVVHENDIHLFRCHKSILLKHSPVFVEMFRLAQTEVDGQHEVPDVTLTDAYQDVESLLNLLYDPL
jgi:BTB/POZ domain